MKALNLSHKLSKLYLDRYKWSDDTPKGIENIIFNAQSFAVVVKGGEWALSECSTIGNNGYNYPTQIRITNPYLENFQGTYDLDNENVLYIENKITLDEIVENEYNLNIPRYVDTFEEEEIINIDEVNAEIADLKTKIAEVEKQMAKYLEELGL